MILGVLVFLYYFMKPAGYLMAPFLYAAVHIGWLVPQFYTVAETTFGLDNAIWTYAVMSSICLMSVVAAWELSQRTRMRITAANIRNDNVLKGNGAYIVTGGILGVVVVTTILIGSTSLEERMSSTWSGALTIYYFFQNLKAVGLFLALYLAITRKTKLAFALLAISVLIYLPLITIYFRRRAIFEFLIIAIAAIYLAKGYRVPRIAIIAGFIGGTLLVASIGEFRSLARDPITGTWHMPSLSEISEVDLLRRAPLIGEGNDDNAKEATNGTYLIHASALSDTHTSGATSWNRFIFQYVPGQLVGYEIKDALMVETGMSDIITYQLSHETSAGSTITGPAEAYLEFGFFGFLFFAIPSYWLGKFWQHGVRRRSVLQFAYYNAGLLPFMIVPTAYAFYFFNMFFLYFCALTGSVFIAREIIKGSRNFGSQPIKLSHQHLASRGSMWEPVVKSTPEQTTDLS